jgi:hypothetical protein
MGKMKYNKVTTVPMASAWNSQLMSDDTLKIKRKLSTLANSLDDLETNLTALSSQSLPGLVIGLDTIQQAKLQVVIPYLVYDLVFGPSHSTCYSNRPA